MSKLDLGLLFQGKTYPVPRKCVFELLDHRRDLMDAKSYKIRSSVPVSVFETFVDSLRSQTKPTATRENAASLSLLAKEFFLEELVSDCAALAADPLSLLSGRVSKLERQIGYLGLGNVEEVGWQERGLERVRQTVETLKTGLESLSGKQSLTEGLVRNIERSQRSLHDEVERLKAGEKTAAPVRPESAAAKPAPSPAPAAPPPGPNLSALGGRRVLRDTFRVNPLWVAWVEISMSSP
jgi:hypothetical protein